jgi:outer membrane protein OmpA-like peptidoglycan-associated protein
MKMQYLFLLAVALFFRSVVSFAACEAGSADLDQSNSLFEAAYKESSLEKALSLLDQSIAQCPTFRAWYGKGKLLVQQGDRAAAVFAFQNASDYANAKQERWIRGRRILLEVEQDYCLSLSVLRELHEYYQSSVESEPGWLQRGRLDLETQWASQTSSADFIENYFETCKAAGLSPRIDIRIHFSLSSANLLQQAVSELEELGKVLAKEIYKDYAIKIIGHTDSQGKKGATLEQSRLYNQSLSEQRAVTVGRELEKKFPVLAGRVITKGSGSSKLLFTGNTAQEHTLNRRVEVVLFEKAEDW